MNELINTIKENVPKVYQAGYNKCLKENPPGASEEELQEKFEEGYDNGLSAAIDAQEEFLEGKPQTHYDIFWDAYQDYGNRRTYAHAFKQNSGWNSVTFSPKYDIITEKEPLQMFYYCGNIGDMSAILKRNGVILDLSNATELNGTFYQGGITKLPALNVSKCQKFISTFGTNSLVEIEALHGILETATFNTACFSGTAMKKIGEITGVIGSNVTFGSCKSLEKATIINIINALSVTTSGTTLTLSKKAVNNAFTNEEWESLAATKPNWTISLI